MKTIFAKYNSERLPKYQIVTKIVQNSDAKRYALKEPLLDEAKEHIDTIFHNYELLTSRYNIHLVQPTKQGNTIVFEMAEGVSLEKLMLQAIHDGDAELFEQYVEKFVAYVDQFVSHRNVLFEPCDQFKAVFGEWTIDKPQDIIDVANIDLIFGNIFLHNNDFTLIDYEWVFEFPIPKSYIIGRAFAIFVMFHNISFFKSKIEYFLQYARIFAELDENFSSYICGINKKYFLNKQILKINRSLTLIENIVHQPIFFAQLFADYGNGFSEETSIKLSMAQNTEIQEFVFDLSGKPAITNLRLDPLNDSCVIEIEKCILMTNQGEIDLREQITTNARVHHANSYFFDHKDPQIYFNDFGSDKFDVKRLITRIRFADIGNDAMQVCINQIVIDKDYVIAFKNDELDQTKTELEQTKTELEQTKTELDQTKTELDQTKKSPLNKLLQKLQGKI